MKSALGGGPSWVHPQAMGSLMFTTGEFSKIARVTRRLLRHYRQIGLFEPKESDEANGYHLYSMSQIPQLNRILALRDLGFSLDQIRDMVAVDTTVDEMKGMLRLRQAELEQTVTEGMQRIRSIESRLRMIDEGIPNLEVSIKTIPARRYLSTQFLCTGPEHGLETIAAMAREIPGQVEADSLGTMVTILHSDHFDFTNAPVEVGYLLTGSEVRDDIHLGPLGFSVEELPALPTAASVTVAEHPDFWHMGTTSIGAWMETNGYQMDGPQREVWHEYRPAGGEPPVVELQIPIKVAPHL